MPRKLGVLAFATVLLLASITLRWYGTGGTGDRLDLSDPKVAAALQYLEDRPSDAVLADSGTPLQAWLSGAGSGGSGYTVNVAVRLYGNPWLVSVQFDSAGSVQDANVRMWGGTLFPDYLRNISIIFFILWPLVAFIMPNLFGVKCPDCPQSFFNPPVTRVEETTVYGGGFDKDGYDLSEIVRRDYVCPRCGYRKITFYIPGRHSGGLWAAPLKRWIGIGPLLNPKEYAWYDGLLNKYFTEHEGGRGLRFPTYDDWKTFYDELKASEREERPAARV